MVLLAAGAGHQRLFKRHGLQHLLVFIRQGIVTRVMHILMAYVWNLCMHTNWCARTFKCMYFDVSEFYILTGLHIVHSHRHMRMLATKAASCRSA